MKNIHVLPTDKPSRLIGSRLNLSLKNIPISSFEAFKTYNIYITSDEEIKEGDWHLHYYEGKPVISKSYNGAVKVINEIAEQFSYKKVILTTDADLINDGVQEINDGFLEWFVKNLNCNFVRTIKVPYFDESNYSYVLIIPLEEDFELVSIGEETVKLAIPMIQDREEIKQETLEEAAERLYPISPQKRKIWINGAKWQKEQDKNLYSEEEVHNIIESYQNNVENNPVHITYDKWFEQFKKK